MNTISNKENIANLSAERSAVGNGAPFKVLSVQTPPKPSRQNLVTKAAESDKLRAKERLEYQRKIEELTEKLRVHEAQSQQMNVVLEHYDEIQSSVNKLVQKQNNNRIRKINNLTGQVTQLNEKLVSAEQQLAAANKKIQELEADNIDRLSMKQNNHRVRMIHQLRDENKQLVQELESERAKPKQTTPVIVNSPSKINYSKLMQQKSIPTTFDYGFEDHHLPGEC
eukprot:gene2641-3046_t